MANKPKNDYLIYEAREIFSAVKLPLKNDILCAESLYRGKLIKLLPCVLS